MADSNVLKAQKYLNNMYGHRAEWIPLDEDGNTGTQLCQGIIRAFQIENGVSSVTGNVGNMTLEVMRSLSPISKMQTTDEPNANVCILQCALFAKGYNAGGITGIYYTSGVNAVEQFQNDANLSVTGVVDWKVWMGLVSLNWFTRTAMGDSGIVSIQRQLNADWSDIIGVGPCDGVVSRFTAYAMIAALQAAEGIYTSFMGSLDGTNFGNLTTSRFPTVLKEGQNGSYVKYNKLVQYGLYLNGFNPGRIDGQFDSMTKEKVTEFQKFYALTDINLVTIGEVNVATMKSLLTSKGDVGRTAKACDCATVLNQQQANDLKTAGYTHVGRYLTGHVGAEHTPKYITAEEAEYIENAGLSVFPIYQDGGYYLDYFKDPTQGIEDGELAILAAERVGIPENTTIYFAVDFDCYGYQIDAFIIPYFKNIAMVFRGKHNKKKYRVGIYGPRFVCTKVSELGLANTSFVADMSSGFSCNLGYKIPSNWAFDQFSEQSFSSTPSFAIDKDAYSGRDCGFSRFEKIPPKTEEELEIENEEAKCEIARRQFVHNVVQPLGYLDDLLDLGIEFDGVERTIVNLETPQATIKVSAKLSTTFEEPSEGAFSFGISVNDSGDLSHSCESAINELSVELGNLKDYDVNLENFGTQLSGICYSLKQGYVSFELEYLSTNQASFSIICSTPDLFPEDDTLDASVSLTIKYEISTNNGNYYFNAEAFAVSEETAAVIRAAAVGALVVVVVAAVPATVWVSIAGILSNLVTSAGGLLIAVSG